MRFARYCLPTEEERRREAAFYEYRMDEVNPLNQLKQAISLFLNCKYKVECFIPKQQIYV